MNINEYVKLAVRTEAPAGTATERWQTIHNGLTMPSAARLLHALSGLVSERGELAYEVRTPQDLLEERGDVSWYSAIILDTIDCGEDKVYPVTRAAEFFQDGCRPAVSAPGYVTELDRYLHLASDIIKAYAFYGRTTFVHPLMAVGAEPEDAMAVLYSITRTLLAEFSTAEIRAANIAKLKARYPDKFTEEAANARADKQEGHQDV